MARAARLKDVMTLRAMVEARGKRTRMEVPRKTIRIEGLGTLRLFTCAAEVLANVWGALISGGGCVPSTAAYDLADLHRARMPRSLVQRP
jgi:hypothetical protein